MRFARGGSWKEGINGEEICCSPPAWLACKYAVYTPCGGRARDKLKTVARIFYSGWYYISLLQSV